MKLEIIAAAILATALITPTFAEDKPTTEAPKAVAPKAQKNTPSKRHSHVEDRHGIKARISRPASPSLSTRRSTAIRKTSNRLSGC